MRTYVIAEAGSCHDLDLVKAVELVYQAKVCGADAVKFQYWSDPDLLASRRKVPDHYREIYRRYQMPADWLRMLRTAADTTGIDFMSTAYLPQDVDVVALFVRHFKIASFERRDKALVLAHKRYISRDRWLIISQGMGRQGLAAYACDDLTLAFYEGLKLLHCTSAYPAPVESLNLRRIKTFCDGYSDHSDPTITLTGALAVAAGANIIEAHLKLDQTRTDNPDAPHAMNPALFREYVRQIRWAERAMGQVGTEATAAERKMAKYQVV